MKMLLVPALTAAATLAGCAATGTGPATPAPPTEAYMALGTEPGDRKSTRLNSSHRT